MLNKPNQQLYFENFVNLCLILVIVKSVIDAVETCQEDLKARMA